MPTLLRVTLNRPEKRNALSIALMEELCEALESLSDERILLLEGAGKLFCSGLDLEEAADLAKAEASARLIARLLHLLHNAPCVTIAVVQGAAIAGGAGLMSACDFALASDNAQFGYPEVRRGLIAGLVMTFLLKQLSMRHVNQLLLTGRLIDAARAVEIGLINQAVPEAELQQTVTSLCNSILKGAPNAIAHTKKLLRSLYPLEVDEALSYALSHHMQARSSEEAREGIQAFLDKRQPTWEP